MSSNVDIANLALTHAGEGKSIANLETEKSAEAAAVRAVFDTAVKTVMRAAPWSFCTTTAALALISEDTSNEATWQFVYRYPQNCMRLHRIIPSPVTYTQPTTVRFPYQVASDSTGLVIWTDVENASVEFGQYISDTEIYPEDFVLALSYFIAFLIAPRLTGGDPYDLSVRAHALYKTAIQDAFINGFMEQQYENVPYSTISEYSLARID